MFDEIIEASPRHQFSFNITSMVDYEPDLTPRHVVDGLLYQREVSILFGPSNCGKTAVAIRLAQHIIAGTPILDAEVRAGAVLYIAAEAPESVKRRAFLVLTKAESKARFLVLEGRPDLSDRACVNSLVAQALQTSSDQGLGLQLVIIDTAARSIGDADENSNRDMTNIIENAGRIASALEAHVLIIHHLGKDAERGPRGAASLVNACETLLSCAYDENGGKIAVLKQRDQRKRKPIHYRLFPGSLGLDHRGVEMTAVTAEFVTADESGQVSTEAKMNPLMSAIVTLLYRTAVPSGLTTDEISDGLPPQLFVQSDPTKRTRKVSDACDALTVLGMVNKTKEGNLNKWSLVTSVSDESHSK